VSVEPGHGTTGCSGRVCALSLQITDLRLTITKFASQMHLTLMHQLTDSPPV